MDQKGSAEYFAELLKRLHQRRGFLDQFAFVPILGVAGYFSFGSAAGGVFGALIGWGICGILARLDDLSKEIWKVEFLRQLYEHTDEAEAGQRLFKFQDSVEKMTKRWWHL